MRGQLDFVVLYLMLHWLRVLNFGTWCKRMAGKWKTSNRDDGVHHLDYPAVSEHGLEKDTSIGIFVAGKKATKPNGATRLIRSSHSMDMPKVLQGRSMPICWNELRWCAYKWFFQLASTVVLLTTIKDEERFVCSTFFTRVWMRQEENQYLVNDIEEFKKLLEWFRERIGYDLSRLPLSGSIYRIWCMFYIRG